MVALGDIAVSVKNGIFVSRAGSIPSGVPILRIGAVRPLELALDDLRYTGLSPSDPSLSSALLDPGDLLFTRYNGNPAFVGAVAVVPAGSQPLTYPDKLIRVVLDKRAADPHFVAFSCSTGGARAAIEAATRTTAGQAGISGRDLKRVPLRLPPLAEQQRIAREVLEVLQDLKRHHDGVARIAELVGATRRSKAHELMRSAFNKPQCSVAVQQQRDARALRPAPPPTALPASVSSVLPEVSLGALCWDIDYGTSTKCSYDGSGTAVLRIPNIVGGGIRLDDLKRAEVAGGVPANLLLKSGDLLIVRSNGSPDLIGRCAPVLADMDAAFASYLIRLRLLSQVVRPEWVALVLGSPAWRELLQARAASSAGQHNLSIGKLASLPMPLPPLHVQDALLAEAASVGERIAQMDATCESLVRKITATRTSLLQQRLAPTEEPS